MVGTQVQYCGYSKYSMVGTQVQYGGYSKYSMVGILSTVWWVFYVQYAACCENIHKL